eukprot:1153596-Pelagomonas_calceolata.AAC.2
MVWYLFFPFQADIERQPYLTASEQLEDKERGHKCKLLGHKIVRAYKKCNLGRRPALVLKKGVQH